MFPVTRLFETEQAAHNAVEALFADEDSIESRDRVTVIHASAPDAAARVDAAIEAGALRSGHRRALKAALARGRSIVSVIPAQLETGRFVERTLDGAGAVDTDTIEDYLSPNPAPFSDLLNLPVLTSGKSNTHLATFDQDSSFGLNLLSDNPTPLSSMFGLPLLSKHKSAKGSSVERMSGTAAPLSSKLGLKLLSQRKPAKGSSVERMSGNAAPFSSMLGLRVLSKRR